jgi:hypothetical protein
VKQSLGRCGTKCARQESTAAHIMEQKKPNSGPNPQTCWHTTCSAPPRPPRATPAIAPAAHRRRSLQVTIAHLVRLQEGNGHADEAPRSAATCGQAGKTGGRQTAENGQPCSSAGA